jgi:hypothetical protein
MNTNDELKEHAPELYQLRKKDGGMRIPEDYFKDFEARIFEKLDQEGIRREAAKSTMFVRMFRSRYTLAAAAALALVIAAVWFFKPSHDAAPSLAQKVELLPEDATFYVLENTQDFDIEQLASIDEIDLGKSILFEQNPSGTQLSTESPVNEASEEEIKQILKDMSEEELESLING